jgi:hypothetical protein
MATDDPMPIPSAAEDVFEIGERTIFRLQNQASPFDPDDLGTMVVRPHPATLDSPSRVVAVSEIEEEPIARLEAKIDALAQTLESLQRRLDSIDSLMARALAR